MSDTVSVDQTIPLVGHTRLPRERETSETSVDEPVNRLPRKKHGGHEGGDDDDDADEEQSLVGSDGAVERDVVADIEDDLRLTLMPFKKAMEIVTLRGVLVGWCVGALVAAMNISFGLKTGWTQGGNIMAAVISMSIFKVLRPAKIFTVHEANICQTTASAAGAMASTAGLVTSIPALKLLGYDYSIGALIIWSASVAYFGGFFALPLRTQVLVKEKLAFPSGQATYETIVAMANAGDLALDRGRYLLRAALAAAAFTIVAYFIPQLADPPILQNIGLASMSYYQWGFDMDPMLFGGGMMSGPKVGLSLAYGAIVAFGIIGPVVDHAGWTPGPVSNYGNGVHGWLLWPGVTLMVCDAITNLAFLINWTKLLSVFKSWLPHSNDYAVLKDAEIDAVVSRSLTQAQKEMIKRYWLIGSVTFVIFVFCTTISLWHFFNLSPWQPLVAMMVTGPLAYVAVRCSGETDINPTGAVGKVTQLLFAAVAPHNIVANLMAASVAAAGATQASDLAQDFKTGLLMRTPVVSQVVAHLLGVPIGLVSSVMVYKLFDSAYIIGTSNAVPAPAAKAWSAVASLLDNGLSALPPHVGWAMIVALILGIALPIINRRFSKSKYFMWIPTASSLGLAFIVAPNQSFTIFYGSLLYLFWDRKNSVSCQNYSNSLASGLVAGAGLVGVLAAVFEIMNVPTLVDPDAGY